LAALRLRMPLPPSCIARTSPRSALAGHARRPSTPHRPTPQTPHPSTPHPRYQARPTPIILILYCFYWAAVITAVLVKWRRGSLFESAANAKRKAAALKLRRAAAAARRAAERAERAAERASKAGAGGAPEQWAKAEAARAAASEAEAAYAAELQRLHAEDEAAMAGSSSGSDDGAVVVADVEGGRDVAGSKDVEMVPAGARDASGAGTGKLGGWLQRMRGQ
jgi:hypothetical protein